MDSNIDVILASASPRREELLKFLYADFKIIPADIDETIDEDTDVYSVAETLAIKKATSIKKENALIIGCDTIVILDGKILGKPKNSQDAYKMLSSLSGQVHEVVTGVCLCYGKNSYSFSETTQVMFNELSDEEISAYIMTGECNYKAGAYGIQGLGSLLVRKINGDFYNVVGLPISKLRLEIKRFFNFFIKK